MKRIWVKKKRKRQKRCYRNGRRKDRSHSYEEKDLKAIQIVETISIKDDEGFTSKVETVLASVRAYKEEKRGTRKWANLSTFTEADCMFTFRVIPNLEIGPGQSIISNNKRYKIVSVQNIRGMYIEVLSVEATKE